MKRLTSLPRTFTISYSDIYLGNQAIYLRVGFSEYASLIYAIEDAENTFNSAGADMITYK